jgi:hypothetical protein
MDGDWNSIEEGENQFSFNNCSIGYEGNNTRQCISNTTTWDVIEDNCSLISIENECIDKNAINLILDKNCSSFMNNEEQEIIELKQELVTATSSIGINSTDDIFITNVSCVSCDEKMFQEFCNEFENEIFLQVCVLTEKKSNFDKVMDILRNFKVWSVHIRYVGIFVIDDEDYSSSFTKSSSASSSKTKEYHESSSEDSGSKNDELSIELIIIVGGIVLVVGIMAATGAYCYKQKQSGKILHVLEDVPQHWREHTNPIYEEPIPAAEAERIRKYMNGERTSSSEN